MRQVLDVLDPVDDPLPPGLLTKHGLVSEDEALRAIHLAEDESERERARQRLTFDEAVGLQWALVGRRHSELSESGPAAPPRPDGLAAELLRQLPFELTAGQREVLACCPMNWQPPDPSTVCCKVRSGRARRSSRCWPCCRWSTPAINARCSLQRKYLLHNIFHR